MPPPGLASDDVKVRLTTIHALVSRWIEERFDRMHLPEEEREIYRRAFEDGREQGMRALQSFQKNPGSHEGLRPGICRPGRMRHLQRGGAYGFQLSRRCLALPGGRGYNPE